MVYFIAHHYAGVASLLNNVLRRLGLRILFSLSTASFRVRIRIRFGLIIRSCFRDHTNL